MNIKRFFIGILLIVACLVIGHGIGQNYLSLPERVLKAAHKSLDSALEF